MPQRERRSFTRAEPFDPLQSRVEWNHDFDTAPVGHTTVATIKVGEAFKKNLFSAIYMLVPNNSTTIKDNVLCLCPIIIVHAS